MNRKFEALYSVVFDIDIIISNPRDNKNDPLAQDEHTQGLKGTSSNPILTDADRVVYWAIQSW